jgi:hypothetical protein
MSEIDMTAVRGLIDPEGRLREADARLDELNARAGGAIGQSVAVPQIASVARLARRLGIPVTSNCGLGRIQRPMASNWKLPDGNCVRRGCPPHRPAAVTATSFAARRIGFGKRTRRFG